MAHLTITKPKPSLWRVSFDNPPVNLVSSQTVLELQQLVAAAKADPDLAVILFESANADFFCAHWDLTDDFSTVPAGPNGVVPLIDVFNQISRLPVMTVSAIRGRAHGAGSEWLLATDIRFASRERCLIGQFEAASGNLPGAGAMQRLPRLVGRGRALEIIAAADDFDGDLAERYGYVNRAVPDAEFDEFIDKFVSRLSSINPRTIRQIKEFVDPQTLPDDTEYIAVTDLFFKNLAQPDVQAWIGRKTQQGLQQHSDVELRLGELGVTP